jgi:hypothetical protein
MTDLEAQVSQQSQSMAEWHHRPTSRPHLSYDVEAVLHRPHMNLRSERSPSSLASADALPQGVDFGVGMGSNRGMIMRVDVGTGEEQRSNDIYQPTASSHVVGSSNDGSDDGTDASLTIPIGHWTTTGSLLQLPQIKSLIGDHPENFFLQLETSRATSLQESICQHVGDNLPLPSLHAEVTDGLIEAFFTNVHPTFPVLDRDMFMPLYYKVIESGLRGDAKGALCLVVLALGKMSVNIMDSPAIGEAETVHGLEYFAPAYRISTAAWGLCYEADNILPLALIHAALYFQHLDLPLQAWRMVYLTSTNLQYSVAR